MAVHRDLHARARLVQLEVQRDTERRGPVALDDAAVEIDADHVARSDLVPREQPRVAEQCPVTEVDRDVPGEVVVVALAPQRAREEDELFTRRQVGQKLLVSRRERHTTSVREWATFPARSPGRNEAGRNEGGELPAT